ncbi:hypothetical protein K504DRAFT_152173 [Pleomassaria siparia CBS 279.74]|uniref:C2H2-type domain-containing protein n=1 Tax=Pleomassaria siparia CBS 279.74 TaxID=1314801 RepID=A0A6G1KMD5_9PLEO|nr:hypothetical protein K504DRAFT_152173 [Pleomassaria siparia CBS 279.74]
MSSMTEMHIISAEDPHDVHVTTMPCPALPCPATYIQWVPLYIHIYIHTWEEFKRSTKPAPR